LVAIKNLVFKEKRISMAELLDALTVNFEDREDLRQMLLAQPKWGNDDDEADQTMKEIYEWTAKAVSDETNAWGKPLASEGRHGTAFHIWGGRGVGALPDGRMAWTHLADGGVSPMTGMDTKGPTSVCNSITKLDLTCSGSAVLNLKFSPGLLQAENGIRKLLALIRGYFTMGGLHVQFNILDRKMLLDAKKHPERHSDLLVRIAGYSARFVDLAPEVQDEIIARTEHGL
jgi:formate C-acetyltransferase